MPPITRSRQDFLDAGMTLLAAAGVRGVTIARVCAALGVTKGSFYHHFRGVDEFTHDLLTYWAVERESQVVATAAAVTDPMERLDVLRDVGVALHHEAEVAIRAWSRTDHEAWTVREQVDAARERTVAEAYREVGVPADVAAMLGRLSVAVLIGAQHRGAETDRAALLDLYRHLQEMTVATYLPDGASTSKKVPPDLPTDR